MSPRSLRWFVPAELTMLFVTNAAPFLAVGAARGMSAVAVFVPYAVARRVSAAVVGTMVAANALFGFAAADTNPARHDADLSRATHEWLGQADNAPFRRIGVCASPAG